MIGVELFEDDGVALVIVPDYQLSLAIGRDGQNVRLAARLTGWRLDIATESERRKRANAISRSAKTGVTSEQPAAERREAAARRGRGNRRRLIRKLEEFRRERLGTEGG